MKKLSMIGIVGGVGLGLWLWVRGCRRPSPSLRET